MIMRTWNGFPNFQISKIIFGSLDLFSLDLFSLVLDFLLESFGENREQGISSLYSKIPITKKFNSWSIRVGQCKINIFSTKCCHAIAKKNSERTKKATGKNWKGTCGFPVHTKKPKLIRFWFQFSFQFLLNSLGVSS